MRVLAPESPLDVTRRGFEVSTAVLDAVGLASAGTDGRGPSEAQLATAKCIYSGR